MIEKCPDGSCAGSSFPTPPLGVTGAGFEAIAWRLGVTPQVAKHAFGLTVDEIEKCLCTQVLF